MFLTGLLLLSMILLRLLELSIDTKARLAASLRFNLALKRLASSSKALTWLPTFSSDTMEPGSLEEIPRTACSGEKPDFRVSVFFAWHV